MVNILSDDGMLRCADRHCSICTLGPLPDEPRAAWIARLRARFAGAPRMQGRRVDLLRPAPTAIDRPEPVRTIVPCGRCGQDRVTGLPCGVCHHEGRTE